MEALTSFSAFAIYKATDCFIGLPYRRGQSFPSRNVKNMYILAVNSSNDFHRSQLGCDGMTGVRIRISISLLSHEPGNLFVTAAKVQNITKNNNKSKKINNIIKKVRNRINLYSSL